MPSTITVHRNERRLIGVNFADDIGSAEISEIEYINILTAAGRDVTNEFRGNPVTVAAIHSTTLVQFWKELPAAGEQKPTTYRIKCRVKLTNDERAIGVVDHGDGEHKLVYLRVVDDA